METKTVHDGATAGNEEIGDHHDHVPVLARPQNAGSTYIFLNLDFYMSSKQKWCDRAPIYKLLNSLFVDFFNRVVEPRRTVFILSFARLRGCLIH